MQIKANYFVPLMIKSLDIAQMVKTMSRQQQRYTGIFCACVSQTITYVCMQVYCEFRSIRSTVLQKPRQKHITWAKVSSGLETETTTACKDKRKLKRAHHISLLEIFDALIPWAENLSTVYPTTRGLKFPPMQSCNRNMSFSKGFLRKPGLRGFQPRLPNWDFFSSPELKCNRPLSISVILSR